MDGWGVKGVLEAGALDKVVRQTIDAIENAKEQIFTIAEDARTECARVQKDLQEIRESTQKIIDKVDALTLKERQARIRLMEVSRGLERFSEEDIRTAYEQARDIQVNLAVLRERENQLRLKRDELERRLRHLQGMVERAEQLMNQVGVVLDFIGGNLKDLSMKMEEAQLRQQAALRIILAQDQERLRVAREIHDGPAQMMSSLVHQAELCERLLDVDSEAVRRELRELKEAVRDTLKDVRKIIYDLRPIALDAQGLEPAFKRYVSDFAERTGLQLECRFLGKDRRLDRPYEVAIFRMVQEVLSNVRKHAQAKKLQFYFEMAPETVTVIVRDDGIGFDPEAMIAYSGEHFGLVGMKERGELLEGVVEIRSQKGRGTQVLIRIPIQGGNDRE
ncbi:histidine kinase [Heliobacillus mobilis]|uniref:Oxygen sensor histidine kinase NreB n=1 Tax=Heliobacterium mobile TaxID=28064 RepID=A0A6I3SM06_HELMO|nr:histidine kinase [Heliobacterium mobile]